jgi:hypothetical protein
MGTMTVGTTIILSESNSETFIIKPITRQIQNTMKSDTHILNYKSSIIYLILISQWNFWNIGNLTYEN